MLRLSLLILALSAPALADVPPPLWAPRCTSVEGCTSCFQGNGETTCATDAERQGFELVCSHHRTNVYCPPARATLARAAAWFVPGLSALGIGSAMAIAAFFIKRRATASR